MIYHASLIRQSVVNWAFKAVNVESLKSLQVSFRYIYLHEIAQNN